MEFFFTQNGSGETLKFDSVDHAFPSLITHSSHIAVPKIHLVFAGSEQND